MAKKPDLSELTKKFDLNSIVGGIKSLLNPERKRHKWIPVTPLALKLPS